MSERVVYHDGMLPPPCFAHEGIEVAEVVTRQSEKDSCDVNVIVARYESTGLLPSYDREGVFADVSEIGDYRSALEKVAAADEVFRQLPAKTRAAFANDPARMLDLVAAARRGDEASIQAMVDLGLAVARPVEPEKPGGVPPKAAA